jgi:membrane-associated phospholipid phosphatase
VGRVTGLATRGRQVLSAGLGLLWQKRQGIVALFLGVFLPLCIFASVAHEVVEHQTLWWDWALLNWFHAHATPVWDRIMLGASAVGVWWGVVPFSILFAAWLVARKRTAPAFFFTLSMVGSSVLNAATKQLFGRERPALWTSPATEASFSFPSGHTMGSMALATSLVVLAWPTRARWPVLAAGVTLVVLVSASRVYLGVHYPSDVLAGGMASLAWVLGLKHLILASHDGHPPS